MKTDLSPHSELTADERLAIRDERIDLLPRADLPVIWDAFKAKAEAVRATAETLTVTCITQKEEMALARTTRLTLREIRIAVENKRVELGESHLKEIKKVNGAATAIKEFIQPLEARLLIQESFAEQHEILRIAELSKSRTAELLDLRRNFLFSGNVGALSQEEYDILLANLRAEKAEIEAANRARIEAEKQLAEVRAEAQKRAIELQLELKAEADRIRAEAQAEAQRVAVIREAQLAEAQAEADRQQADAEQRAKEIHAALHAEHRRQQEEKAAHQARIDAEKAIRDADLAEQKRIRDIQFAALEAELNIQRAAKLAEEKRVMELALAPDVEKLWQFAGLLRGIQVPGMVTPNGIAFAGGIYEEIKTLAWNIEETCKSWGLTGK